MNIRQQMLMNEISQCYDCDGIKPCAYHRAGGDLADNERRQEEQWLREANNVFVHESPAQ